MRTPILLLLPRRTGFPRGFNGPYEAAELLSFFAFSPDSGARRSLSP
jgi:hypothetical protein